MNIPGKAHVRISILKSLLFFGVSFHATASFSQTAYIDSVRNALKKPVKNDTMRAFQYNELAWSLLDFNTAEASKFRKKAYDLSKKIGYMNGVAEAMNTEGIILRIENKPKEAIRVYSELISIRKKQKQYSRLIGAYSNLGSVYYESGNNAYALKYYEKAFQLSVDYKEKDKQLVLLSNLGVAYKASGLYKQALETFEKGIELNKKIKDIDQEIQLYLNIATVYDDRKLYSRAIESNEYALSLLKKKPNTRLEGVVLYNLASQYKYTKSYDKARKAIERLALIDKRLNEKEFSSSFHALKANFYNDVKDYATAFREIEQALVLADSVTDPVAYTNILLSKADILRNLKIHDESQQFAEFAERFVHRNSLGNEILINVYETLYDINKSKGNLQEALSYLEKSKELKESSALESVNDQIATLNSLNDLDRKEKDLEIIRQKNEKIQLDNERKGTLIAGGGVTGLLILVLLVLSYRAYRSKRKANHLLHSQNHEISMQKEIIEEKQKEIVDSILYAKRIQNTLLASEKEIAQRVKDSFIYFQPKDIVSGDFYWCASQGDLFYLAVCDSTGHGVPGAFMSLLNITFLNEAINEKKFVSTAEILNHVRERLISNISHDGAQDGMDGVLFCFNNSTGKLSYSAAYNPPVRVRNGESVVFPADKMPIGQGEKKQSFTEHEIDLEEGDIIYAYTDGYGDQFGGERGKKFKTSKLIELLVDLSIMDMNVQQNTLKNTFENWRGSQEQIDDVTLVGIKFK